MKDVLKYEGDDKRDNDPWGRGKNSDTPPDLDEVLKKIQEKLSAFFGNSGKGSKTSSSKKPDNVVTYASIGLIGLLLVALWGFAGIFIVGPAEEATITRFGQYRTTVGPGLNWAPRFIDKSYIVDVQKVADYSYSSTMLTKDENIVSVELAVQYRVDSSRAFLFNVNNPFESLQQATASALRHVVGHTMLSDILTTGREELRQNVKEKLTQILARYDTGLVLTDVVMQPATPPEEVKGAFDDVIKAQEDEQRFQNHADAYKNEVVQLSEGKVQRILAAAKAYKKKIILAAEGETSKFEAILPEVKRSPKVTMERLYLDTMESVLSKTSKVVLDSKNGNSLTYLPLDKIISSNEEPKYASNVVANHRHSSNKEDESSTSNNNSYRDGRNNEENRSGRSY